MQTATERFSIVVACWVGEFIDKIYCKEKHREVLFLSEGKICVCLIDKTTYLPNRTKLLQNVWFYSWMKKNIQLKEENIHVNGCCFSYTTIENAILSLLAWTITQIYLYKQKQSKQNKNLWDVTTQPFIRSQLTRSYQLQSKKNHYQMKIQCHRI